MSVSREYQVFFAAGGSHPPVEVERRVLEAVRRDLNPAGMRVFLKLLAIHAGVSLFTLALCPQFGLRLYGSGPGLMKWFLWLGMSGCLAACGAFFLGSTVIVAALALRPEELRVLRAQRWLQVSALALLSLGTLVWLGGASPSCEVAGYWTLGAVLAGITTVRGGRLRASQALNSA